MTIEGGTVRSAGLVARIKNILLTPKTEWEVIDDEPATVGSLYLQYAVILAAIPALATFIGGQVFGVGLFGVSYKPPLIGGLVTAIITYGASLLMVAVLAFVIDMLAPSFDGTKDRIQAFKVAVYASTAGWIAGIFGIYPLLGILAFVGFLYGCYLIYLGLPRLMRAPESKALGYTIVTIIVALVLHFAVAIVVGIVTAPLTIGANLAGGAGTLNVRGNSVNLNRLEQAAKDLERAAENIEASAANGSVTINTGASTAPDVLQGLLPASLPGGFARTEISSGGMQGLAMGAEAVYQRGDSRIELNVVDSGAMGALAGIAGSVTSNRTTSTGYEKMGTVNGRMTTERYDRSDNSGEYAVMVGNRFMVTAEGNGVTIQDLKNAVEAVSFNRLEAMAKG